MRASCASDSASICSWNKDGSTLAAAPASSRRRRLSTLLFSGDADATIGFFKVRPRYLVLNDMMASLRRLSRVGMEPAAVTAGEFLVLAIFLRNRGLRHRQQRV